MRISLFSLFIVLILNSCIPVGGNCNYQRTRGKALIKFIDKNRCLVDFNDMKNVEAQCIGDIIVGQKYFAVYEKATLGSCTPYFLRVYHEDVVKKI